jgi:hypothetical protein
MVTMLIRKACISSLLSGTSIRVPEITEGNPLKTCRKTQTTNQLTHLMHTHNVAATAVAPVAHQGDAAKRPSGEVHLARGLEAPLGRGPPRSRARRPLGRGPPRSRAERPLGRGPPRSRVRRVLEQGLPRSRTSTRTRSHTRVRAFNALTRQGRATTPRGRPSPLLCNTVRQGRCQLRDTVPPTPVRLTCRTLEGGRRHPRISSTCLCSAMP